MHKSFINKKTVSFLFLITSSAIAADGTIKFTGNIADQTCVVDSSSQNQTVELGKVTKASLNGAIGQKSSPTRFTLVIKSCPETVTGATFKFDGIGDDKYPDLLTLDSGVTVASGVAVEIADKTGTPIPLHIASRNYPLTSGTNSLDFVARYVSTAAAVTVGSANATTQFTIIYK
ncbi:fimbrial protein [Klebsiella sp. MISC125]|uniref:fimbrial protein n=1 Tax=Klebsiella sp. MISC125 TaxID=2755386 RepID=UPI003DA97296